MPQERAQAEKEEDEAEDSIALELDEGNAAKADDEEGEERGDGGEQDKALIPEVLRKKTMNVGSMDALRKRIAVSRDLGSSYRTPELLSTESRMSGLVCTVSLTYNPATGEVTNISRNLAFLSVSSVCHVQPRYAPAR